MCRRWWKWCSIRQCSSDSGCASVNECLNAGNVPQTTEDETNDPRQGVLDAVLNVAFGLGTQAFDLVKGIFSPSKDSVKFERNSNINAGKDNRNRLTYHRFTWKAEFF